MSQPSPTAWRPLLEGGDREAALTAVAEIADALARLSHEDPSLADGSAGRALLHTRLADHDPAQRDAAVACLRHAATSARETLPPGSLLGGVEGVGWALSHLGGRVIDERDRCSGLDRAMLRRLDGDRWTGHFDLVVGLAGFGVYACERLDQPLGRELLARVVRRLAATATSDGDDVYWVTPPEHLPPNAPHPASPHVDLGLAHGVPGPIALLGAACAADVATEVARPLVAGAVRWLLRQQEATGGAVFAERVVPGQQPRAARTAWCYGAPGIAAALSLAARGVDEPAWHDAARHVARRAAARAAQETGVVDAALCHGAAGLGLVFARLHHATGDPELGEAARFWFARTLALRQPGTGIAGFTAEGVDGTAADPGLLHGATGVGLALHAAATGHEPTWDRLLLLSATPLGPQRLA